MSMKWQFVDAMKRALRAGLDDDSEDDEIDRWARANITSDVLMYMVKLMNHPLERAYVPRRIAQLAACRHTRGTCTGILASRGYTGHHNAALFVGVSGTVE